MDIEDMLKSRLAQIPIFKTLQLRPGPVSDGTATLTAPYDSAHDGIFQSFHGGLLMTLADTAACVAVLSLTGTDQVMTTTDMNIRFLAPCNSDAIARARVIKFGKTLVPVQVDLFDSNGKQVAVA